MYWQGELDSQLLPVGPDSPAGLPAARDVRARARGGPGGQWLCRAFAGDQTSLRAELVALLMGVRGTPVEAHLYLFTDCLVALLLLTKWWTRPNAMVTHHERVLVQELSEEILGRTGPTTVVKVKGHSGLRGNEIADAVANLAAEWASWDPSSGDGLPLTVLDGAVTGFPRGRGLAYEPPVGAAFKYQRGGDLLLTNHKAHLGRIGSLRYEAVLAGRTKGTTEALGPRPLDEDNKWRLSKQGADRFWGSLRDWQLRTSVRVRSNDFFSGVAAWKSGAVDNPYCTLCTHNPRCGACDQAYDGWAHALTACAHTKGLRIARHNCALTMISCAIGQGTLGNARIFSDTVADRTDDATNLDRVLYAPQRSVAGQQGLDWADYPSWQTDRPRDVPEHDCPEDSGTDDDVGDGPRAGERAVPGPHWGTAPPLTAPPREDRPPPPPGAEPRIDALVRQSTVPEWVVRTTQRPDLVLVEGGRPGGPPPDPPDLDARVRIYDVTYTSERNLEGAAREKMDAYKSLVDRIRQRGWRARPAVPLVLGVRGGVPVATYEALLEAGINKAPARRLMADLHLNAVTWMQRILHAKRAREGMTLGKYGIATKLRARNRKGGADRGGARAGPP